MLATRPAVVDLFAIDPLSLVQPSFDLDPLGSLSKEYGMNRGCFHVDISNEDYHQLPDSVSCSGLKHLLRSPAHFQAYLEESDDGKPNIGTALHCTVLEPDLFETRYTCYSGRRGTNDFKAFEAENIGKVILTAQEWIKVQGMAKAIAKHKEFPLWKALQSARREFSIFWTDEETGITCRVRLDALCAPFANFDLKTTTDARPEKFIRQAADLDYDLQAAMYSHATQLYTGEILPFNFVAVEENNPHGIWIMTAGQSMIENGWKKFRRALATYKRCTDSGEWPGYTNAISTIELPKYALLAD